MRSKSRLQPFRNAAKQGAGIVIGSFDEVRYSAPENTMHRPKWGAMHVFVLSYLPLSMT